MKIFKETQRFDQWWLIVLMIFVVLISFYSLYQKFKILDDDDNREIISFATTIGTLFVANLFIFSLKLKIKIDERGITYQFFPIHFKPKNIAWPELNTCYVRKYSPVKEYGAWGIRGLNKKILMGFKGNGKAYNVKGNMGIQLEFKDGGKLLFGTQEPEKARQVIKTYSSKLNFNSNFQ